MHEWMLEFVGLLRKVPDTVWAAVIAASIAFLTTILTNKNSRKQLRMQLQHEAQERERERAMALRRDVFLPAAEALIRGQHALGQVVNIDAPIEEAQKLMNSALTATSKIHLVADESTVRAVMAYTTTLMPAYMELLQLRVPILIRANQAKSHQAIADRAFADLTRTNELMKQFNISGQTDQGAWARLVRQSEAEQKLMQEHIEKANGFRSANMVAQQAMGKRSSGLSVQLARCFPDALLSARKELGLPIDEAAYRELFATQEADAIKTADKFFAELGRLLGLPPKIPDEDKPT